MFADIKVQRVAMVGVFMAVLGGAYSVWVDRPSIPDQAANFYTDLIMIVGLSQIALMLVSGLIAGTS